MVGCISNNHDKPKEKVGNRTDTTKVVRDSVGFLDVCTVAQNVVKHLSVINTYPKKMLIGNKDECVLKMLDSLVEYATKTEDTKYLKTLESLCKTSDGYVSEAFDEISLRLFQNNFYPFFRFIYDKKDTMDNCLRGGVIMGYSYKLLETNNKDEEYSEIDKFINQKIKKHKLNSEEKSFLILMRKQFNSELVD